MQDHHAGVPLSVCIDMRRSLRIRWGFAGAENPWRGVADLMGKEGGARVPLESFPEGGDDEAED